MEQTSIHLFYLHQLWQERYNIHTIQNIYESLNVHLNRCYNNLAIKSPKIIAISYILSGEGITRNHLLLELNNIMSSIDIGQLLYDFSRYNKAFSF